MTKSNNYITNNMRELIKDDGHYAIYKKFLSNGYPFDVVNFGKELGIKIVKSNFENFNDKLSGLIIRKDGQIIISVKAQDIEERQRFTVAHELGHFFLHQDYLDEGLMDGAFLMIDGAVNKIESEANNFAANLLMPESLFRELWNNKTISLEKMAQSFYVSCSAIMTRAKFLKIANESVGFFG
jgi:Zn-dependent peptidase ImmA (M78 family)